MQDFSGSLNEVTATHVHYEIQLRNGINKE